jgi:ketosteroid isomerase-like protein
MEEREKVELFERAIEQWNKGDLEEIVAAGTPDIEWDLTQSDIPGETGVYRGAEEYLRFARGWREALGPTQLELEEAFELDDGRLFALLTQKGTGVRSGVNVDIQYVQILSFEGSRWKSCVVFTDLGKARAAAGLDP